MAAVTLRDIVFGGGQPFVLIAGPCVIESEAHATGLAEQLADITARAGVPFIFKASYDKANRTPDVRSAARVSKKACGFSPAIKSQIDVPILTDIHEPGQADAVADVVDILQIPAFLSRQTDLLVAAAKTGRVVNIKKGQFLAPDDVKHAVAKVVDAGNSRVIVTERGTSFGYHNLIVDMRGFPIMREQGFPVVFDVTHSLQLPGGGDGVTAGLAQYIEPLASAGVAAGVDGVFLEVHEDPAPGAQRRAERAAPRSARTAAPPVESARRDHQGCGRRVDPGRRIIRTWLISPSRGKVLETEAAAILALVPRLDDRFDRAVDLLLELPRPRDPHRHGQVRHHLPQDCRDARPAPARPRSFSTRPKRFTATSASFRATMS